LHDAGVMLAGGSCSASASHVFAPVLARIHANGPALFGSAVCSVETADEIVGVASRLLPVRVRTGTATVDLFLKRFVPVGGGPEELPRLRRYLDSEVERIRQAAAVFQPASAPSVPHVVACFPDLLALVTERAAGDGLERVVMRLGLFRSRKAFDATRLALERVGGWIRRFQAGVPVRNPAFRKNYREYLDIRLRALAALRRGGFTEDHRRALLTFFDRHEQRLAADDLALVAIHADLCPANVLVRDTGVTVLDFAMSSDGNKFVDLAHVDFHVKLLARRWRLPPAVVRKLENALLQGFDPALRSDVPLFKLMRLQHMVCHLAGSAPRANGVIREWRLRRRLQWGLRMAASL
jgi:Phosphotransferase enzyme family